MPKKIQKTNADEGIGKKKLNKFPRVFFEFYVKMVKIYDNIENMTRDRHDHGHSLKV